MFTRIKDLRISNAYKQDYVADYLALSQSAYSRIENGASEITGSVLVKLATLYQVPVDYLLNDDSQREKTATNLTYYI
ncbi:helix-turn-helix transcriptional regulator [Tuanshanicoccus lijuaniae]|uniref:helix-turn-helix domain-containing protein n=1 Tax=Aerococcaceae bacterium zg-1292 TaxID=2774330 RepID=UPI001935D170|nr:helix-turn-helix transcriptional regulator [Aerococcaceae bacterium zg-1292]MBF6625038.1 helix-turn-helix transcriptional regulator [Aerococcaceae bacterium zg-BR9]MBF6978153.1 helix-turn-helix transcriptional regulator [Aerococcaceae bacterium zg-BR22]MBS4456288.1 helix-turn-helix transcriptional regulator [Aerococcaceae bacterium zg-A91]MBS4458125.1 helix-turn-helix transcriptional regulator [Aerococcaceae bacterium zg-BR33]